jgi:hypothetical protein
VADCNAAPPSGAYGFRLILAGSEAILPDLVGVSDEAPAVPVDVRLASIVTTEQTVEDGRVALLTRGGTGMLVRRDPPEVTILAPLEISVEALVHPVLTVPLSILARWRGDVALHGGGFHHAGATWGVIGERTAGKSSMLGLLGDRGVPIAADDLLVIDDGWVRAGPHCVDLRPDVAPYMPAARDLGVVGSRPRHRLSTPPAPARSRLGGIFVLEWHDDPEPSLSLMPMAERLRLLYKSESIALMGFAPPGKVLELLGVPMWRFARRRDWSATDAAVTGLLEAAAAHAP